MRLPQRSSKAFTLIELIVVIVILGILALIAIPTFGKVIGKTQDESTLTTLRSIARDAQALRALDQGATWGTAPQDAIGETNQAVSLGVQAAGVLSPVPDTGSNNPLAGQVTYKADGDGVVLAMLSASKRICIVGATSTSVGQGKCVLPGVDAKGAATTGSAASVWSSDTSVLPPLNLTGDAAVAPAAPTNVVATVSGTTATVTWVAASGATSYVVRASSGQSTTVSAPATTAQVAGLPIGGSVTFTVTATNASGSTVSTVSAPVTPSSPVVTGGLDTQYGSAGVSNVSFGTAASTMASAVQADDKVVQLGFIGSGSAYNFVVTRTNVDGTLDNTFGTNGIASVDLGIYGQARAISLRPDGKILIAGQAKGTGTFTGFAVAQLNSNGSLDTSFGSGGKVLLTPGDNNSIVYKVLVQPDGKVVLAGQSFVSSSNPARWVFNLTRLNVNGSVDTSFGSSGTTTVGMSNTNSSNLVDAQLLSSGKIVVAGSGFANDTTGVQSMAVARFSANGAFEAKSFFTPGTDSSNPYSLTVGKDGSVFVFGSTYIQSTGVSVASGAMFNSTLNQTRYYGAGSGNISLGNLSIGVSATTLADGKILIGGPSTVSASPLGFTRLNADGTLDTTFANGSSSVVAGRSRLQMSTMSVLSDGSILAGGNDVSVSPRSAFIAKIR